MRAAPVDGMIGVVGGYRVLDENQFDLTDVEAAIAADGRWRAVAEVRMGAGPIVELARRGDDPGVIDVQVTWGTQQGRASVAGVDLGSP